MIIVEHHELLPNKSYLMHNIDNGETVTCQTTTAYNEIYVQPFGYYEKHRSGHYGNYVFVEIEMPSRSDWALAILQKDSQ